ncbi:HD domain-containing protein [Thalassotalea ponticola]|uniref:HD domain-containing protein n=1 Tax=Thalassotalea ponticola TaxID=1523392 RepID=UPI0025B5AA72|nr:HD domain-containing protein [Thalassotalea ponticola]MDN3651253.1 HD domain-containing protein [Thalassotalea ponticola]
MNVVTRYDLVDEVLEQFRSVIDKDFDGYRNHITRMLNYCHFLLPTISPEDSQKIQIAAVFHDIALWTHNRVDYLVPSYQDCHQWLEKQGLDHWKEELQIIIDMHHLVSEYKGPHSKLAEIFRKADLVDFSLGFIRNGIDKSFIKEVKQAIPNAGFHKALIRFSCIQLGRNPLNPLPMMRINNIYKR